MERYVIVEWLKGSAKGCVDEIPLAFFEKSGRSSGLLHTVKGPEGDAGPAKFDLSVKDREAQLDYRPYGKFNRESGIILGVMKLGFTDNNRGQVLTVHWKDHRAGATFEDWTKRTSHPTVTLRSANEFDKAVRSSLKLSETELRRRIAKEAAKVRRVEVVRSEFSRNQYVVALVLRVADGKCSDCGADAPFVSRSGDPYLEVHHIHRLADGGEDTVENAIALCPNCHRKRHYGPLTS